MAESEDVASKVSRKIMNLTDLSTKVMKELMLCHAEFQADKPKDHCSKDLIPKRLEAIEDDETIVLRRLESLRESFCSKQNNLSSIVVADSNSSEQPSSENDQNASKKQKGCGGPCCEEDEEAAGMLSTSGLIAFCGENMKIKEWVEDVDWKASLGEWTVHNTYKNAFMAMRGKARKIALSLAEKTLLDVPLSIGEPKAYEDPSFDMITRWERKLTDEQVINLVVDGWGLPRNLYNKMNWSVLKTILMKKPGWEMSNSFYFLGFEKLLELEES